MDEGKGNSEIYYSKHLSAIFSNKLSCQDLNVCVNNMTPTKPAVIPKKNK